MSPASLSARLARMRGRQPWGEYLVAIALGNLAYFALFPLLPGSLQHQVFQLDLGLALDFLFCVGAYLGLRRWVFRRRV